MNLGFKQYFDHKKQEPTYFREKILAGVGLTTDAPLAHLEPPTRHGWAPKLHTIRLDPHNRWKPGMSIQMVYRGPKYSILDHFNKGIPELEKCVSVQKIEIRWWKNTVLRKRFPWIKFVKVDGRLLNPDEYFKLIRNDGFDSTPQFQKWFNEDFTGKLIHWTDLKY